MGMVRVLVVAMAGLLAACVGPQEREAWYLLADLSAGPGPSPLKSATPPPSRQAISFTGAGVGAGGETLEADLYTGQSIGAALVLIPGAAPQGRHDPRLVALAESLARVNFAVMVPDLETLRTLRLSSADAHPIAATLTQARQRWPDKPLVLAAISYGVGPAVLALVEQAELSPPVDLFVGLGGYFDTQSALTFAITGQYRDESGQWLRQPVDPRGKWLFVESNAHRLDDPLEARRLALLAQRRFEAPNGPPPKNGPPDVLEDLMGAQGRAVLNLVTATDPNTIPPLIAALPEAIQAEIQALDLSRHPLATLGINALLIHGRDDPVLPYPQSIALAQALNAPPATIVDNMGHASPPSRQDARTLLQAALRLLAVRD